MLLYLGGVYISIGNGLPAALSALIVGLQPLLTSTIANRLLGERVVARQWGGLLLGIAGVYLVVQDKATTRGATPLAWVASLVALLSITFGTIYQKRFGGGIDWRPGMLIQYSAAGVLFALGAMAFETRIVHWTPDFLFALAWLVIDAILLAPFNLEWLPYTLDIPSYLGSARLGEHGEIIESNRNAHQWRRVRIAAGRGSAAA